MPFDWKKLLSLLPVIATAVNPAIGGLASALTAIGEEELANLRASNPGLTDEEILAKAQADWDKDLADAEALAAEGHENDPKT